MIRVGLLVSVDLFFMVLRCRKLANVAFYVASSVAKEFSAPVWRGYCPTSWVTRWRGGGGHALLLSCGKPVFKMNRETFPCRAGASF